MLVVDGGRTHRRNSDRVALAHHFQAGLWDHDATIPCAALDAMGSV